MACGCGECRLLRAGVAVHYTAAQASKAGLGPVCLGLYTSEAAYGHERLYLFRCRNCYQLRLSVPCEISQGGRRLLHLHCYPCEGEPYLVTDAEVFRELGMPEPTVWQQFFNELRFAAGRGISCRGAGSRP